ncbi:MAG: membrane protein insertase YidC [Candidatus Omnitrophota bacterium]
MGKDKNFLLAVLITLFVLFFYPKIMMQFFPQAFPEPKQQTEQPRVLQTAGGMPAQVMPKILTTYSKEKSYVLENDRYVVTVNTPRGDIKSLALKKYIDPKTGQATILMDTNDEQNGLFDIAGDLAGAELKDVLLEGDSLVLNYAHPLNLEIKKTINLSNNSHVLGLELKIKNNSAKDQAVSYKLIAASGIEIADGIDSRYREIITIIDEGKSYKKSPGKVKTGEMVEGKLKITALKTRYFALALVPFNQCDYSYISEQQDVSFKREAVLGAGVKMLELPANAEIEQTFALYAGPNDFEVMTNAGFGIDEIRGSGFFAGFSDFLLMLLRLLHNLFRNYGVAVIALSIVVNAVLYPLTFKSLKSMKDMQALQPHVEKLRNDHKDNPEKLNKEIMELYKKNKVNPMGGCLPMLFQMPVFFSLYRVLMQAVDLRGAGFLWIKDLSGPDALFVLGKSFPFIGNTVNLLPVLMIGASFLQQKMTNPSQTNEQQKMMATIFPIFMGAIFYKFPSGLVLYFLTNTIFSLVMQSVMTSKTKVAVGES